MKGHRLPEGGDIDRHLPLFFRFDGRRYSGFHGDTLASALLANGVRVVGRSFKYHRPRGIMAAGVEEPNALVRLESGAAAEVNLRATEIALYEGLSAWPVNCWPNARVDVGALNGVVSRFLPAGFYYKTFMWPDWHLFEGFIRRAAGLGAPSTEPDPDTYDTAHAHCDVLVVGAGPCGLTAALAAARTGARVILCESEERVGGSLRVDDSRIDGLSGRDWVAKTLEELSSFPETILKTGTVAVGYFDHNAITLVQSMPRGARAPSACRQRLWQVRAARVVLATGALERPLVFPGNDRPGVMLASAVRAFRARYGVRVGQRMAVFTNNDTAYATAGMQLQSGGKVCAIVDTRKNPPPAALEFARSHHIPLYAGAEIVNVSGRSGVRGIEVRSADGGRVRIDTDVLAMSGGFNPTVHLFCQSGGRLQWDDSQALFKPDRSAQSEESVGACRGLFDLSTALAHAHTAGETAAALAGHRAARAFTAPRAEATRFESLAIEPKWLVRSTGKAFVDFQNDVTADDIALSARENYASVEHLKRYTTLGMAPDQGKTSNVNGLAILGELTDRSPARTGTTRYRFPFTPVSLGVLGGRARSSLYRPMRHLACHARHAIAGAVFDDYGGWQRPAHYLRHLESAKQASEREVKAVRHAVGLFDGSPLGKLIVKGRDAGKFLDRICANAMSTLPVGRLRYGMMLDEAGVIIDDGVTARLADDEFWVGTSSGGAIRIADWLERWHQCEWPDDEVLIVPVTQAWSVITVTGPRARQVLEAARPDFSVAATEFRHMSFRDGRIGDMGVRVMRASYSGEVSFEINLSPVSAPRLWDLLLSVGASHAIEPVGIDAWDLLRMDKGFLHLGSDTDGTTTAPDVGWHHVLQRDVDFIGRRSLMRPENRRADRFQFVAFQGLEDVELAVGSHASASTPPASEGYVTSSGFSHAMQRWVALGMLRSGRVRLGQIVTLLTPRGPVHARVISPNAYDPTGARLNV